MFRCSGCRGRSPVTIGSRSPKAPDRGRTVPAVATTMAVRRGLASDRVWRPVLRAAALAAGLYGVFVFVVAPLTGHFSGEFEDFAAYLGAARAAVAHGDIYAAFTQQTQNVALSGFDYPPLVALLVSPLALVSANAAATAWLLVGVAATLAGAVIVARTLLPATWPRVELAVLATFLFAPATYNLWHGQMNPVIFLALALGLRAWVRGEQTWCGVFVGAAAAIKLAPLVLIVLMLRRRWWRGAVASVAVFAASAVAGVLAFGVHTSVRYVQSVLPVLSRDDGWLYNQSWSGVVNRAAAHSVLTFDSNLLLTHAVSLALSVACIGIAAWAVRRDDVDRTSRGAQYACGVIAMLLAGTITWYAHDVHLLIPIAAAAALLARERRGRGPLFVALLACLLATAVLAPFLISIAAMPAVVAVSHGALWWPVLQLASLPALTAAGLLLALALTLRRRQGRPARATRLAA